MGRCEEATLSIGVSVAIKDLLDLMTEENYKEFRKLFFGENSIINDSNSSYSSMYNSIVSGETIGDDDNYVDLSCYEYKEYKQHLLVNFKLYGDILLSKYESSQINIYKEDDKNNLYHQTLIVPFNKIISTERWGYSRDGTNGTCCNVDIIKLNEFSAKIKETMTKLNIDKYSIDFILTQHAG